MRQNPKSMMISGEEQNPLKCLCNLGGIWNGIALIFYLLITDFKLILNRCDRTFRGSTNEEKRNLINQVFVNLELNGHKLLYTLRSPFDIFAKTAKTGEWYPRPDLNRHEQAPQILSLLCLPFHHAGTLECVLEQFSAKYKHFLILLPSIGLS